MLFQKKSTPAGTGMLLQTKHKGGAPMVFTSVAQSGHQSNGSSVSGRVPVENKVVLTGIDTLVITAGGAIAPSKWLVEQQEIWSEYQNQFDYATDELLSVEVNGAWYSIKPKAYKQYKFVLYNPEIGHIRIWNVDKWSSAVPSQQHIYIDFASSWIHQQSQSELFNKVAELVGVFFEFVEPQQLNIKISRADLHADTTNGNTFLSESQIKNTITRSKYRSYFVEDDTITLTRSEQESIEGAPSYNKGTQKLIDVSLLNKLMKIADNQISVGADNVVHKREIETAYFGKKTNDVWGKVYDKTKCVKVKNDLDTPLLWLENGWNETDVVVRTEFSMKRSFIKEMDNGKYIKLDEFINNMSSIWEWMTTKWMRMVDEVKKNNIQLSQVSKFWKCIQESFKAPSNNIIRKRNYEGKFQQVFKQGIGCIKQAIALGMNNNDDAGFTDVINQSVKQVLTSSYHSGEILQRRLVLGLV